MNLKTILIIVAGVLIGASIILVLGYFNIAPFNVLFNMVQAQVPNIPKDLTNPTTIIAGVGSAVAIGAPLASKLSSAKKQVTDAKASLSEAENKVSNLTTDATSQASELKNTNLSLESAQTTILEQKKTLDAKTAELKTTQEMYSKALDDLKLKSKETKVVEYK